MTNLSNIEFEKIVIGGLLSLNNSFFHQDGLLTSECFTDETHQIIFKSIEQLARESKKISLISLQGKLNIELLMVATNLSGTFCAPSEFLDYCRAIKSLYIRRMMLMESLRLQTSVQDLTIDIFDIQGEAIQNINDLAPTTGNTTLTVSEILPEIKERHLRGGDDGLKTGFRMDAQMTMRGGDFIVIAARPSVGKTAFAINLAANVAKKGNKVLLFTLEMSRQQIVERLIASQLAISGLKLRDNKMTNEDFNSLNNLDKTIADNIYIQDKAGINILGITGEIKRINYTNDLKLIIVDYLTLIQKMGNKNESTNDQVSAISRSLKIIAKELNIPVIALSQMSRAIESRTGNNKKPFLSDLRDSGGIEQDADTVIFLHRDEITSQDEERQEIELICAKHRSGALFEYKMSYVKEFLIFEDEYNPAQFPASMPMTKVVKMGNSFVDDEF